MLVLSSTGGHTLEQYPILSLDLPYSSQLGTITGISYDSTSFSDSSSETAELCYHLAYQNNPVTCQAIIPNFTGEVTAFNGLGFRNGVKVSVHHRVEATGSFHYLQPTKEESITFHYTVD